MSVVQNKPPQTARDRLAQISHHFLSDDDGNDDAGSDYKESKQAPKNDVYTLAVLNMENDGEELPVSLLSQQLAARGRSATILDSSAGMNMASSIRRPDNKSHDVHFLLVDTPESSCLSFANKILLTAPATPEGIQRTYISIKQLAAHHKTVQVGVTITGTSDAIRAEDCFNRLATAVNRFLERDLLSYGYLPAPSGISGQTKVPHTAQMSLTRSGITIIAKLISDEIGEWEQDNVRDDRQKTQPINPAPTNDAKSLNIKSVAITSDDNLLELVTDALPNLLGHSYELVSDDLPFDGNHILALDAKKQSFVISFDNHDGGRALQYGLSLLEGMSENREMIQRLYPTVFNSHDQSPFRIEDTHLIVLSPNPPPGGAYLTHVLSCPSFYTFHALQIDDKIGLLIEPCFTHKDSTVQHRDPISDKIAHAFRGGKTVLSQEETAFFQSICIK
jgi:hypothetical protein